VRNYSPSDGPRHSPAFSVRQERSRSLQKGYLFVTYWTIPYQLRT